MLFKTIFRQCILHKILIFYISFLLPACQHLKDCPFPESLEVPALEKCILGVVQEIRWVLHGPQHGSVELMSLPGQTCQNGVLLTVSENEPQGITVGQFCPQGAIQKMQINVANITVSASSTGGKNLRQITNSHLQVSFNKSIKGKQSHRNNSHGIWVSYLYIYSIYLILNFLKRCIQIKI